MWRLEVSVEGRHVCLPYLGHTIEGCPAPGKVGRYFEKQWCTVRHAVHRCFSARASDSAYFLDNPGRSTISYWHVGGHASRAGTAVTIYVDKTVENESQTLVWGHVNARMSAAGTMRRRTWPCPRSYNKQDTRGQVALSSDYLTPLDRSTKPEVECVARLVRVVVIFVELSKTDPFFFHSTKPNSD